MPALIVAAVFAVLSPARYESKAVIISDNTTSSSGAGALAAQFGIALPVADGASGAPLLAEVVVSAPILHALLNDTLLLAGVNESGTTLQDLFDPAGESAEERLERATETFRERIVSGVDRKTGALVLRTWSDDPQVAQRMAVGLIDQLLAFNVNVRQSRARAERMFSEERLLQARSELASAEADLETFLRINRSWQGSPELTFAKDRLERQVSLREQVLAALAQSYERARLDEVRDTPALTVVEPPLVPALPSSMSDVVVVIVTAVVAACFGALVPFTSRLAAGLITAAQARAVNGDVK